MDPIDDVLTDPEFLARYEVAGKLGEGGMGVVYRAVQRSLGRPVAIKFMHGALAESRSFQQRFLSEAQLAAGIIHSNVVVVFDRGISRGVPYLVTEFVDGKPLTAHLELAEAVSPRWALTVARHVLSGLQALHARGIVHRDLKPSNILVAPGPLAKVHDFGIAKELGETASRGREKTAAGLLVGTPQYMSPEQALGRELSPASDLYSMTIVLFEMVTGQVPFDAPSALEVLTMQVKSPAPVPAGLGPALTALLEDGLAKEPDQRIPDAATYLTRLDAVEAECGGAAEFRPKRSTDSVQATCITPRPLTPAPAARDSRPPATLAGDTPGPGEVVLARSPRRLVQLGALILSTAALLFWIRHPGSRLPAGSEPWALRLEEVRELGRKGQVADAVRQCFAVARSQPTLAPAEATVLTTHPVAPHVQRTLLSLFDAAARAAKTNGPTQPPPESAGPATEQMFLAIGTALHDRDFAKVAHLTDRWLIWRRPHGLREADPDAASLPSINAVSWLHDVARLAMAIEPWQVSRAVGGLYDQLVGQAAGPLVYWSLELEGATLALIAMPSRAESLATRLSAMRTTVRDQVAEDGLSAFGAFIDEARRTVEARWKSPSAAAIRSARLSLLTGLVIRKVSGASWRDLAVEPLARALGGRVDARWMRRFAEEGKNRLDVSDPPPLFLLRRLVKLLDVEDHGLVDALRE